MPIKWHIFDWHAIRQLVTLAIATPFLLFPTQFAVATCAALLLIAALWLWPTPNHPWPNIPQTPINTAVLVFTFFIFIGILVTADPEYTLPKATGLLLGLTVWLTLSRHLNQQTTFQLTTLLYLLMGLGFTSLGILTANWLSKIPAITAIVQQIPSLTFLIPESPPDGVQTNQIASTILIWLPLLYSVAIGWLLQKTKVRPIFWVGLALTLLGGTFAILITQSRSGYLGFLVGGYILVILWRQQLLPTNPWRKWLTAVSLLGALAIILFIGILGPDRLANIWEDPNQSSLVGTLSSLGFRQEVWHWAIEAIKDFPFTGTGLGTFRVVVRRLYPINVTFDYDIAHAHNIFMQTALDLGIFGLIAYLSILATILKMGWQVARNDAALRPLTLGLLSGIISLHLFGLTDALSLGAKPGLLLWLNFGLITAMYINQSKQPTKS